MTKALSCGVLVTDGVHLLLGHATRSTRWDIPKGLAEDGELPEQAARRELQEETGLEAAALVSLGQFPYLPRKELALFIWNVATMPDPAALVCRSTFLAGGRAIPEFDRFDCPRWPDGLPRVGKAMGILLTSLAEQKGWI